MVMKFLWILPLALLPIDLAQPLGRVESDRASARPNIIFIMSDDQGYGDLGCYGSEHIRTPNLDRMASEGLKFSQAYAGSPVCAPTRCSLLTGLHSGHITRRDNRSSDDADKPFQQRKLIPMRPDDFTIGALLQTAGYATGCIGKWGLGNPGTTGTPDLHGFDYFFGYLDQVHAHDYYAPFLMRNLDTIRIAENESNRQGVYTHDLLMEEAYEFVRSNKDHPFFLYLPLTLPHGKYVIPDNSEYADQSWPEEVKNYAAMVTLMDRDVGRLLALLKELTLDDNTIVFFTSDNGPNPPFVKALQSNKPFRGGKRQLLEGGIRVPMIARWPGVIEAGGSSDYAWAFWDVLPTLAELADVQPPADTDGVSIVPTLLGAPQPAKEYLYWEYYSPFQQAVRVGQWKGIRLGIHDPLHLYDLRSDLQEKVDLADKHPQMVQKMEEIMTAQHEDTRFWPVVEQARPSTKAMLLPANN